MRLTADEVAVACAVVALPGHELLERPEARARLVGLRDAGVVDEQGALVEPAATIVGVLARAELKLDLRVWRARTEVVEHRVWTDDRDAVIARISPAGLDLKRIAWEHVPLAVAVRLGLLGDAVATDRRREPLVVAPEALIEARLLLLDGDRAGARAVMDEREVGRGVAAAALRLAEGLCVVWSVAAAWRETDGTAHRGSLSALNGGPAGWWQLVPDAEAAHVAPSDPQTLWTNLHALLPREVQD